jgi:hypothetical protein
MSGSPIVAEAATAIGLMCTTTSPGEGGPNARLSDNLPGWLFRDTPRWRACTLSCSRAADPPHKKAKLRGRIALREGMLKN